MLQQLKCIIIVIIKHERKADMKFYVILFVLKRKRFLAKILDIEIGLYLRFKYAVKEILQLVLCATVSSSLRQK